MNFISEKGENWIPDENFYKDANREIYQAIIDLFNNSEPVDLLTVTAQLKKNGKLDIVGGSYYVTQLTTRVNSASNIDVTIIFLQITLKIFLAFLIALLETPDTICGNFGSSSIDFP